MRPQKQFLVEVFSVAINESILSVDKVIFFMESVQLNTV